MTAENGRYVKLRFEVRPIVGSVGWSNGWTTVHCRCTRQFTLAFVQDIGHRLLIISDPLFADVRWVCYGDAQNAIASGKGEMGKCTTRKSKDKLKQMWDYRNVREAHRTNWGTWAFCARCNCWTLLKSSQISADTNDDISCADDSDEPAAAATDCCDVCLVAPRDARIALVPYGHQRFWASCAEEVHTQGRGCPLCRNTIVVVATVPKNSMVLECLS